MMEAALFQRAGQPNCTKLFVRGASKQETCWCASFLCPSLSQQPATCSIVAQEWRVHIGTRTCKNISCHSLCHIAAIANKCAFCTLYSPRSAEQPSQVKHRLDY